ncbi:FMRFamide receptor [Biomphalaria pfeifferi]|uniref:FMRFamide receptor n=1 Tax=Biomphalaria pfeifferi TaxID=112525 RepID=A0AAD8F628_BIOPF|nr:FMRFamide receptor [Biomphalaria pfeifferi]
MSNFTRNCRNESFPWAHSNSTDVEDTESDYYYYLYFRVYELYISGVLFYLLPYALIPILNIQLLLAIKRRRVETRMLSVRHEHQQNFTRATDLEDGVTLIVLGITACFFVCCLIPAIYNMSQIVELPDDHPFFSFLLVASDTMLCINASTDFFFYCLWGRKFRNIFLRLFCPKRYFNRSRTMTSLNQSYYRNNRTISETTYHSV